MLVDGVQRLLLNEALSPGDLVDRVFKGSSDNYGIVYDADTSDRDQDWDYTTTAYVANFVQGDKTELFDLDKYILELDVLRDRDRYFVTGDINELKAILEGAGSLKNNNVLSSQAFANSQELFEIASSAEIGLHPLIGFTINTNPKELGITTTRRFVIVPFMHPGSLDNMGDGAEKIQRTFAELRARHAVGRPRR